MNKDEKIDIEYLYDTEVNFKMLLSFITENHYKSLIECGQLAKSTVLSIYNEKKMSKSLLKRILSTLMSVKALISFNKNVTLTDEQLEDIIKNPDSLRVSSVNINNFDFNSDLKTEDEEIPKKENIH